MVVVLFLLHLFARNVNVFAADRDYIVAAVGAWIVDGLVFAHQHQRNLAGDSAERAWFGGEVDEMPGAGVGEAGL